MKYFMLDIETMGTDFETDDIIQVALLELTRNDDGHYQPGRSYNRTLYTAQEPKSDFIRNMHKGLLKVCRKTLPSEPWSVRCEMLEFIRSCGVNEPAMIMGLNATTFDVPYLVHKGFLRKPFQDANNRLVGDYHYRIYELKGAFNLARDVLGLDEKVMFDKALKAYPEIELPAGSKHEALYDCYNQTKALNGLIRMLREAL